VGWSFQVGADVVTAGPGSRLFAPRNTPHTLANLGTERGLLLCVFAPAGFERRFERMLAEQSGGGLAPELRVLSEAERRTQMVGPPLSAGPSGGTP
jgi:hypothetical protein